MGMVLPLRDVRKPAPLTRIGRIRGAGSAGIGAGPLLGLGCSLLAGNTKTTPPRPTAPPKSGSLTEISVHDSNAA